MSTAAVYNVTRGLRILLHSQLAVVSPTAVVTLLPPGDKLPDASGVNLYLYRVMESPFSKNQAWPGDRVTPPSDQPALGLQLFYLLTPLGTRPDDASFTLGDDAHTMLGVAMSTLQEHPVLNDVHIPGFDADTILPDFLRSSFERIKVTLVPTSVEELSKIWATINQPYRLSVAYEVSLVQLTPTAPPPVNGGVVLTTNVEVFTLDPPRLTALSPATGALAHVAAGNLLANDLVISGFGFVFPGQSATARVGGQPAVVKAVPAPTNTSLTVTLPLSLDAGPQEDVRVTLNGRASTPLTFNVNPWLQQITPLRADLGASPTRLLLDGFGFTSTPQMVRLDGPGGTTNVSAFNVATDRQIDVDLPATLANGLYSVRVVLNDAPGSASNGRTLQVIPRLDTPIGLAVVTVAGNQVHQLTMNGARLNGSDVRVIINAVIYQAGTNANASQLVFTLGRILTPGPYEVSINVDGHGSHAVGLGV